MTSPLAHRRRGRHRARVADQRRGLGGLRHADPDARRGQWEHAAGHRGPPRRGRQHDPHVRRREERTPADRTAGGGLQGGSSDATWRVTLDFGALGIPQIRQMWLTFAPPLADGAALADTEWEAVFTNWTLTGPETKRALSVAGPGSVRVEENDSWCTYSGDWAAETGFYSGGYARRRFCRRGFGDGHSTPAPSPHDLYIGTSLYSDRGVAGSGWTGTTRRISTAASTPNRLWSRGARCARRFRRGRAHGRPSGSSPRGTSTSIFWRRPCRRTSPIALPAIENIAPALDYSTDHTYKLPPARILWMFDQLGFAGPMNEYIGVFWWNQRQRVERRHSQRRGDLRRRVPARRPGVREHRRPDLRQDRVPQRGRRR